MANPEHLKILKQGVEVWNRWRRENPEIEPDLAHATLRGAKLSGANFFKTHLAWSDFSKADLTTANFREAFVSNTDFSSSLFMFSELSRARFIDVNFHRTNMAFTSALRTDFSTSRFDNAVFSNVDFERIDFSFGELSSADLSEGKFSEVIFNRTILNNVDFSRCVFWQNTFGLTDLSTCKGLDTVQVSGPCIIDFHTLRASRNLPKSFLLKIGLPENYINYLPDFFDENPIRMYPVFLSHSWQNKNFAGKLYEALIARGVQVWYDEKKMKPGDDIYESLSRGIEVYDKMIIVCSRQSLSESWWVDREIDRILAKERQLQKERGKRINLLIPIRIDDHIFEWDGAKGEEVRRYIIGDFRDWQDEAKFQKALDELIAALNVDRGDDAPPSFL